jgi:branched-chain amino acid transport system substrate-binding protein
MPMTPWKCLKWPSKRSALDKAKIRDAIEGTKNYVGVSGIFNMSPEDHNGLTPEAFVMVKIDKGDFKYLE